MSGTIKVQAFSLLSTQTPDAEPTVVWERDGEKTEGCSRTTTTEQGILPSVTGTSL